MNNTNDITLNKELTLVTKFNNQQSVVDNKNHERVNSYYRGRQYQIIVSIFERMGRSFLRMVTVICTLSINFFSNCIKNLFIKLRINSHFYNRVSHSNLSNRISSSKISLTSLDPVKEKIMKDFTPQMIEALGGIDNILNFPMLEQWNGEIYIEHLKAPVMRGYHTNGCPFLLFCYLKRFEYGYKVAGEYLGRTKNESWEGAYAHPSELNLRSPNPILDGSLEEKYMLEKISRIIKGESIGAVERFPGVLLFKPANKSSYFPKDAYLKETELYSYMDIDTLFYERKPKEGTTELFLYDPRISEEENKDRLKKRFRATVI